MLTTEHTLHCRVNLSITQNVDCFFLKLQNHTLNECTNLLYKFEENPQTEFFSILLQTFISNFSYIILNNGFHTAKLTLSTCYTELSSLLCYAKLIMS